MDKRYFRVLDDTTMRGRWFLGSPVADVGELDPREFTEGRRVDAAGQVRVPLRRKGKPLDFTFADFDMPVVRTPLSLAIESAAPESCQRFPVRVEGSGEAFDILNVTTRVRCLDEVRSGVTFWTENDHRKDLAGQYRMVSQIRIHPGAAAGHDIFRLDGWEIALIVSSEIKTVLSGAKGILFEDVTS